MLLHFLRLRFLSLPAGLLCPLSNRFFLFQNSIYMIQNWNYRSDNVVKSNMWKKFRDRFMSRLQTSCCEAIVNIILLLFSNRARYFYCVCSLYFCHSLTLSLSHFIHYISVSIDRLLPITMIRQPQISITFFFSSFFFSSFWSDFFLCFAKCCDHMCNNQLTV